MDIGSVDDRGKTGESVQDLTQPVWQCPYCGARLQVALKDFLQHQELCLQNPARELDRQALALSDQIADLDTPPD